MADLGNEEAIKSALECMGSHIGKVARGWVHGSCPLAKHRHQNGIDSNPSFGVSYNSGESKRPEGSAHCFSCGYSGDVRELASLLYAWGELPQADFSHVMNVMEQVKTGSLPLSLTAHQQDDPFPDAAWLESFPPITSKTPAAVEYLNARGITRRMVSHFGLRFDPQRYRVVFPLYDRVQRLRGVIGRTLLQNPEIPRYFYYPYPGFHGHPPKGFTWFNEHDLDLAKPVLVVEGVFDALKAWATYPNVTAALSIAFRTPGMGWHTGVKRWVSMFDVGKGGEHGRARLQEMVPPGARLWHLPPPPGRKDPGDSTPEEIKAQLETLVDKPGAGL